MSAPTRGEWALFAAVFGEEEAARSRHLYAQRRRAMLVRMTLAVFALVVVACMALGGLYGFLLLMIAAFDAVVGY